MAKVQRAVRRGNFRSQSCTRLLPPFLRSAIARPVGLIGAWQQCWYSPVSMTDASKFSPDHVKEARLWHDEGWTARVIKNEDDDGWAVEMTKDGEQEPALVGPWTMGRDKKNPKPLDATAFSTLVKTAHEVRRRHQQHLHALLHKKVIVSSTDGELSLIHI